MIIMMQIGKSSFHVNCNVGRWTCLMVEPKKMGWKKLHCLISLNICPPPLIINDTGLHRENDYFKSN